MQTPGLLNILAWLLAFTGCGLKFFSDRLREPPAFRWEDYEWSEHEEAISADFTCRRFAVWKRLRADIGTILTIAGVGLGAALQFPASMPVVVVTRTGGALLAAWLLWRVFRVAWSLLDLHDRERWEQVYELGKPFRHCANDPRECFLIALKEFAQKHPREHRRLARTLLAEYDEAQRAQEREWADRTEGLKRILA